MNLNESYRIWSTNPTPENYEILGHDLLVYIKGRVRKLRSISRELRDDLPVRIVIRVLEKQWDYNPARSPYSVWVNYKVDDICMEALKEYFNQKENPLFDGNEAPDKYKGINARLLLKRLMKTLSVDERALVEYQLAGLSDDEIALEMGIPIGTVWSRWNRIKEKMRKSSE